MRKNTCRAVALATFLMLQGCGPDLALLLLGAAAGGASYLHAKAERDEITEYMEGMEWRILEMEKELFLHNKEARDPQGDR